jgi:acetyl esterase/lipase
VLRHFIKLQTGRATPCPQVFAIIGKMVDNPRTVPLFWRDIPAFRQKWGKMRKLIMIWRLILVLLPEGLVRLMTPGNEIFRGNSIDIKARAVGRLANYIRVPGVMPTPVESRAQMRKLVEKLDARGPKLARVQDLTVNGADGLIAARLYSDRSDKRPALVYFHGGGFIQGDLETHDDLCRKLAGLSGFTVIAVDYRLAPEHPYPAGLNDARAAFADIVARADELGIDPKQVGAGGDSAGGCFAAVLANADGPRPAFQVLIYPALDSRLQSNSIKELSEAYVVPLDRMQWYRDNYLGAHKDFSDPSISPLLAEDFTGISPVYILSGGFDPLQDEATQYEEKLRTAGTDVTHRLFSGQIHGFLNLTRVIPEGTDAIGEIADWMRKR